MRIASHKPLRDNHAQQKAARYPVMRDDKIGLAWLGFERRVIAIILRQDSIYFRYLVVVVGG